ETCPGDPSAGCIAVTSITQFSSREEVPGAETEVLFECAHTLMSWDGEMEPCCLFVKIACRALTSEGRSAGAGNLCWNAYWSHSLFIVTVWACEHHPEAIVVTPDQVLAWGPRRGGLRT